MSRRPSIDNKWQVQLSPVAYKNGKRICFDKILLSGAQFLRQQEKGYRMYQNFISSIIPRQRVHAVAV
ncbi:hypothetical protein NIB75_12380 [Bacteroides uniformis]|nr:hypothetical protein [Bacteroides uniformis]